ncbi:hypothetical protein IAT38_001845 [Cryptococcus sp. DSM 104549]
MSPAAVEAKELGTLIVVVGKARNLPNKSRFGKQDPFCVVTIGDEKHKTKAIKRGGQHPEWDEEFRFAIFEDVDDVLTRSESQNGSLSSSLNGAPAPLPKDSGVVTSASLASKSRKAKKKGGKSMKIACFADDAKEPELIGDCVVDIDEALKKGEVDEWYEFTYKDKYSGEIYMELTFYSNDAPPIRRNVPRPSIPHYGGAGTFDAGFAGSVPPAAGGNRVPGLTGSISGANLYIPPYAPQAGRVPSPAPSHVAPGNSFAELGLPPRQQLSTPVPPAQAGYRPGHASSLSVNSSSIDALTRPMSSMSLGPSYSNRPLSSTPAPPLSHTPVPPAASTVGHGYGSHRHSVGGPSDAPWGAMLPQSQPAPAPTPQPRPMSTNDAISWEQTMRLEADRLRASATPVPRPTSGQSYASSQLYPPQQSAPPTNGYRAPSPIPESLRPAAPTQQPPLQHQPFSQPPPSSLGYPGQPPTPAPPLHSHSAPDVHPGSVGGHYQVPSSSFGNLVQPPPAVDPRRASSPGPGYFPQQPQQSGGYQDPHQSQQAPVGQHGAGGYATPTRSSSYPVASQPWNQTPPPQSGYYPPGQQQQHQPHQPQHSLSYNQILTSPTRDSSPAPPLVQQQPQQGQENGSGYVPWYQQTQPATQQQQQPSHGSYGGYDQGQQQQQQYQPPPPPPLHSHHSLPSSAPPVPERRPQPQPPAPPRPSVGYYPSDELFAQAQQRQDTVTPQPQAPGGWQAPQQPQQQQWQTPPATQSPHQNSWQPPPPPQPSYTPAPTTPQSTPAGGYYNTPPPAQSYQRVASPQPIQMGYQPPHPQPPVQSQSQPVQLDWQAQAAMRSASPIPPPPPLSHSDTSSGFGAGGSGGAGGSVGAKPTDWRSYMSNLGVGGAEPARSTSPQPPPKDAWSGGYGAPPKPPAPEGWRSTLPAQQDGHQWRA